MRKAIVVAVPKLGGSAAAKRKLAPGSLGDELFSTLSLPQFLDLSDLILGERISRTDNM
jgi:hypothetical protein